MKKIFEPTTMRLAFEDAGLVNPKSMVGMKRIRTFWQVTYNGKRVIKKHKRERIRKA